MDLYQQESLQCTKWVPKHSLTIGKETRSASDLMVVAPNYNNIIIM